MEYESDLANIVVKYFEYYFGDRKTMSMMPYKNSHGSRGSRTSA